MTSYAAKLVARRLFKETSANKMGQEDPYFETVPTTRLGFIKSSKKKKKALPPGLTAEEEAILVKAKRRAYRVDLSLGSFLGTRIGWGAIIGLVPAFGDFADLLLALMVYRTCCSVKPSLPASVTMRMQINILIDFVIGLIPFIGDVADAVYKCNTRNVILLENELRKRGKKRLQGTSHANVEDLSIADEFDYQEEERMTAQHGPPPRYTSRRERPERGHRERDLERGEPIPPPKPARPRQGRY